MANTTAISCPECDKQINVPSEMEGKKIRCKECGTVFAVKLPAAKSSAVSKKPVGKPAPGPKAAKPSKPAEKAKQPPKTDDEDEEGADPYKVTHLDLSPRCPHCANEMESADSIICLTCGYNTQTRVSVGTRKVEETTGGEQFLWLLPGIACVIAIFIIGGAFAFYYWELPPMVIDKWDEILDKPKVDGSRIQACKEDDMPFVGYLFHPAIGVWVLVFCLFAMYKCLRFAIKRLIQEPRPPEKIVH